MEYTVIVDVLNSKLSPFRLASILMYIAVKGCRFCKQYSILLVIKTMYMDGVMNKIDLSSPIKIDYLHDNSVHQYLS